MSQVLLLPPPAVLIPLNTFLDENPHLTNQQMNNRVLDWFDYYDHRPDLGFWTVYVDPDEIGNDNWLDHVYLRVDLSKSDPNHEKSRAEVLHETFLAGIDLYETFIPDELTERASPVGDLALWFYCWWD